MRDCIGSSGGAEDSGGTANSLSARTKQGQKTKCALPGTGGNGEWRTAVSRVPSFPFT